MTDETPIYCKPSRYPFVHKTEVEKQIKKMFNSNIMSPRNSQWSAISIDPKNLDSQANKKGKFLFDSSRKLHSAKRMATTNY